MVKAENKGNQRKVDNRKDHLSNQRDKMVVLVKEVCILFLNSLDESEQDQQAHEEADLVADQMVDLKDVTIELDLQKQNLVSANLTINL
jgi:hypothetical protein